MSKRDDSRKPTKKEIIKIARQHKIKIQDESGIEHSKELLIRTIQQAEGNTACYKTNIQSCAQNGCSWYRECQK